MKKVDEEVNKLDFKRQGRLKGAVNLFLMVILIGLFIYRLGFDIGRVEMVAYIIFFALLLINMSTKKH